MKREPEIKREQGWVFDGVWRKEKEVGNVIKFNLNKIKRGSSTCIYYSVHYLKNAYLK